MRESNTSGTMRGVGYNPLLAWARFKLVQGEQPVVEHGLGISATIDEKDGKILVKVDGGIKPRYWTPVISSVGTTTFTIERLDEPGGTFTVIPTWPEEPPAEEPSEEPTEPPAEPPAEPTEPEEEPPGVMLLMPGVAYLQVIIVGCST